MRNLIIGMGEVGKGLFTVLSSRYQTSCRDKESIMIGHKIDILHICIPYSESFTTDVEGYIKLYTPDLTIIYSSVPIGTSEKLGAVHSPVEGKHPVLGLSIQNFARWYGSSDPKKLEKATKFWEKIGPTRTLPSADFTEWLKLRSTSKYGINLVWADYEAEVTQQLGMDFSANKQYDNDYNGLYKRLGMLQYQRYILDPPKGKIGGHCVRENSYLLDEAYPNDMLKMIQAMKGSDETVS